MRIHYVVNVIGRQSALLQTLDNIWISRHGLTSFRMPADGFRVATDNFPKAEIKDYARCVVGPEACMLDEKTQ